jgi:hypothetical protein
MQNPSVLIVGAGISGVACARALRAAGITARIVDRGQRPGGRMASRTIDGRPVDLGAAYFTAEPGSPFAAVADEWLARGLVREWTDTVAVAGADGIHRHSTGPMRYAAPGGLRELVVDLAAGLEIESNVELEALPPGYDAIVLAMPDPQARGLLDSASPARGVLAEGAGWVPTIAVALEWASRDWEQFRFAFVNDVPELTSLADDGDRRGDGAPVLVAHTTESLARDHLDDPDGAIGPVTDAVRRLLSIPDAPVRSFSHRWTFARPAAQHPEPFLWSDGIGVCGDAWGQRSSVGTAWMSGDALGKAIAAG